MQSDYFVDLSQDKLKAYSTIMGTTDMKQVCQMPFTGPTNITSAAADDFRTRLYDYFDY